MMGNSSSAKPEKLKVQVWIHGQTAQGDRRVLLFKTNAKRGNFWQPVTGGVEEKDADLEAAALREATEESGLEFLSQPRSIGFEFTFQRGKDLMREHCFEIQAKPGQSPKLDPNEHTEAKWVSPDDALKLLKFESNAHPLQLLVRKWKTKKPF